TPPPTPAVPGVEGQGREGLPRPHPLFPGVSPRSSGSAARGWRTPPFRLIFGCGVEGDAARGGTAGGKSMAVPLHELRRLLEGRFPDAVPVTYRTAGAVATGLGELDRVLPGGGLPRGRLAAWVPGGGATAVLQAACLAAVRLGPGAAGGGGAGVVVRGVGWVGRPLARAGVGEGRGVGGWGGWGGGGGSCGGRGRWWCGGGGGRGEGVGGGRRRGGCCVRVGGGGWWCGGWRRGGRRRCGWGVRRGRGAVRW